MTDYSSSTPQDFTVTDLSGGSVWTHGLVNTGGSGTQSSPFTWQAALSATGSGQFTLHYWRSGSTNNWGHTSRTDITSTVSSGVVTIALSGSNIFTFNESDAFVSTSGGGTSTEGTSYSATLEVNSSGWLEYTIPTTSSSGTYYLLKSSDGGVTWTQHGQSITHGVLETQGSFVFDQTLIWIIRSPTEDELDRWSPPSTSSSKKVFCNFW